MGLKEAFKMVAPPVVIHLAQRIRGDRTASAYGLSGDYHTWNDALAASTGYDSEAVLETTKAALLKVKNGEAVHERDSVLFDEVEYAWPVLAGLMWIAARSGGTLSVLDFGGSLGSTYFQNRLFLSALRQVRWNIVEQPRHAEVGNSWFADDRLRLHSDIPSCLADSRPNVVLFSGVLQYLERPYDTLAEAFELPCDHVIIDRTPFWAGSADRLCVQTVPPSIYPASYPSWILSRAGFQEHLERALWHVVSEFSSLDNMRAPVKAAWRGMILERKKRAEQSTGTSSRR
jgi:putative methyltransferase (TIGR04325 family)